MIDIAAGLRITSDDMGEPCAFVLEAWLLEQRAQNFFRFRHCFTATMQSAYLTCGVRYVWLCAALPPLAWIPMLDPDPLIQIPVPLI
ncbi:hypothetical protein FEP54_06084 [Burkholderia multivorans]|nr:hypothetical protein [Burkholderia multivorans]MDR8969675.1 hypothetical protein [Burkholderia multivorans]MDR8993887.1 hypothetical protein [Burkholderia multivorans]MDR9036641.1 hypothetical protein [Burkholderia multivorans]MDR9042647.1 hypothetical protein [Burkholderia multivorans]